MPANGYCSPPSVPPGAACSQCPDSPGQRHLFRQGLPAPATAAMSQSVSGDPALIGLPAPRSPGARLSFPLHAIPFPCLPFPDPQPVPVSRHSPFPFQIPGKSQNPAAAEGGIFRGHARCHIIVAVTPAAFPPRSACQRRNIRCSFFPPSFPSKT